MFSKANPGSKPPIHAAKAMSILPKGGWMSKKYSPVK